MNNPIVGYDFTIPEGDYTAEDIEKLIYPGRVKKYAFQLEESEHGYRHFQGRIRVIKKIRPTQAHKMFRDIKGIHLSPTTNEVFVTEDDFYVLKDETRIGKSYTDKDKSYNIPRQVRDITLKRWQRQIVELSSVWDTRSINIIYDTVGNIGKSVLTTYMGVYKLARQLPYCNDYKDIMRMVMDMPTSNAYIIDMPRAISKDKLFQLFGGIETVKSGYAYDDRYSFKDKYFDCPNIFVFMNTLPDLTLLSGDRWKIWEIVDDTLTAYHNADFDGVSEAEL